MPIEVEVASVAQAGQLIGQAVPPQHFPLRLPRRYVAHGDEDEVGFLFAPQAGGAELDFKFFAPFTNHRQILVESAGADK